jgi:hypothetical protein
MKVIVIYFDLAPSRSRKRAKTTSEIAAIKGIEISEWGVKAIIKKWRATSKSFIELVWFKNLSNLYFFIL